MTFPPENREVLNGGHLMGELYIVRQIVLKRGPGALSVDSWHFLRKKI